MLRPIVDIVVLVVGFFLLPMYEIIELLLILAMGAAVVVAGADLALWLLGQGRGVDDSLTKRYLEWLHSAQEQVKSAKEKLSPAPPSETDSSGAR